MDILSYKKQAYDKQNDFKKGNKNPLRENLLHSKSLNHEKLYQSVSSSIQLRPTFLKKKVQSNTAQFCSLYSDQILKGQVNAKISQRFLARHDIDAYLRAKMIDWMIEVTSSYKFASKTFFDGIQLMDRYFQAEETTLNPNKLHIIGVQCMFIASKMNEVFPLRIKTVYQKIGHKKLPVNELVAMQERIIKNLNFKLNSWTFYDLAMFKLSEFNIYEEEGRDAMKQLFIVGLQNKQTLQERQKTMEQLCTFVCRHVAFDYDLFCEHSIMSIAESCVKTVLQMMGVVSIPSCFYSSSSITLKIIKQKILKVMKNFKTSYGGLQNIFKYTSNEILEQVSKFTQK